jgi:hypothetical protein
MMISGLAFGYKVTDKDEFVRIAEEAQLAMVSAARPGAYLVDFLPFLKFAPEWFPGADFKRVAREGWELGQDLQNKPFAWAKKQFDEGRAEPSFFKKLMETQGIASDDPVEEQIIIKCTCAVLYASTLLPSPPLPKPALGSIYKRSPLFSSSWRGYYTLLYPDLRSWDASLTEHTEDCAGRNRPCGGP